MAVENDLSKSNNAMSKKFVSDHEFFIGVLAYFILGILQRQKHLVGERLLASLDFSKCLPECNRLTFLGI